MPNSSSIDEKFRHHSIVSLPQADVAFSGQMHSGNRSNPPLSHSHSLHAAVRAEHSWDPLNLAKNHDPPGLVSR
jgi:hypothetical protein